MTIDVTWTSNPLRRKREEDVRNGVSNGTLEGLKEIKDKQIKDELARQMNGTIQKVKDELARQNVNTLAMRLFHGGKEVDTDDDLCNSVLEGSGLCQAYLGYRAGLVHPDGVILFPHSETTVVGHASYALTCDGIHLQLVVPMLDGEDKRKKLMDAIFEQDSETVKEVLESGQVPVFVDDSSGLAPAMIAAAFGSRRILHLLQLAQTDFQGAQKNTGRTPLHFAAEENNLETARFLVEQCKVDVNFRDCDGLNAFHLARELFHFDVSDYLGQRLF